MNSPVVLIQQKNKFYDFIIYWGKKKETLRNRLKCVSHTDDTETRHGAPLRSLVIQMRHARAEPLTHEPTQICKFISALCFRGGFLFVYVIDSHWRLFRRACRLFYVFLSMATAPTKEASSSMSGAKRHSKATCRSGVGRKEIRHAVSDLEAKHKSQTIRFHRNSPRSRFMFLWTQVFTQSDLIRAVSAQSGKMQMKSFYFQFLLLWNKVPIVAINIFSIGSRNWPVNALSSDCAKLHS